MNKIKTINELNNIIVDFIENNKFEFGIGYEYSIGTIQDLLNEIKAEYENLGLEKEENGDE